MIVAIEGIDGAGKFTQSTLLADRMSDQFGNTRLVSFPDYDSTTGKSITKYLSGNMDWLAEANPYIAATLFAANRAEYIVDYIGEILESHIIFNRYVLSNVVYQSSRVVGVDDQIRFEDWLLDLEFNKFRLPKPSLVIILDLNVEEALLRVRKRQGDQVDIHESNRLMLEECRFAYLHKASQKCANLQYEVVSCSDAEGKFKPPKEIHEEVWTAVQKHLPSATKKTVQGYLPKTTAEVR